MVSKGVKISRGEIEMAQDKTQDYKDVVNTVKESYSVALNELSKLQSEYVENIQKLSEFAFGVQKTMLETTEHIAEKAPEAYGLFTKQTDILNRLLWTPSKVLRSM